MIKSISVYSLFASLCLLVACKKEEAAEFEPVSIETSSSQHLAFFLEENSPALQLGYKLHEIDRDGTTRQLQITLMDGSNFYEHYSIQEFINVSDDYSLMQTNEHFYAVDLNSGDLIEIGGLDAYVNNAVRDIQNDLDGNMYLELNNQLMKIDAVNFAVSTLTLSDDKLSQYVVDEEGNVLMEVFTSDISNSFTRLRRADGSWASLPGIDYSWDQMWLGLDNEFYYYNIPNVLKVEKEKGEVTVWADSASHPVCGYMDLLRFPVFNALIGIDECLYSYHLDASMKRFSLADIHGIDDVTSTSQSESFIYIAGSDVSGDMSKAVQVSVADSAQAEIKDDVKDLELFSSRDDLVAIAGFDENAQDYFIGIADFNSSMIVSQKTYQGKLSFVKSKN